MERYLDDPDPMGSTTPAFNTSTPTSSQSYTLNREPVQHSEQKSETSSNSEKSFGSRNMYRGNQRGGRGGHRGGRGGNRTYSGSSGSSNGQYNPNRPTLKPTSASQSSQVPVTRMENMEQTPARVNSPVTPVKQLSSFDLNGNSINETYIARASTTSTPPSARSPIISPPRQATQASPRHAAQASPRYGGNRPRFNSAGQRSPQRPITRNQTQHWAHYQELKLRLSGLPKSCWTKEVYQVMASFGAVIRIEMVTGTRDYSAYVVFRPPPVKSIPHQNLRIGGALVGLETLPSQVRSVPSPANPAKSYYEINVLPVHGLDFGVNVADKTMIAMHTLRSQGSIYMTLNLMRKELDVLFSVDIDKEMRKFRFALPIALLSRIYKTADKVTGQPTLIIPFSSPPQFYVQRSEGEHLEDGRQCTTFSKRERSWNAWDTWYRATDIINNAVKSKFQGLPLMNHKDTAIIDIGQWTSYRMIFDATVMTGPKFKDFSDALADHGVAIEDLDEYTIQDMVPSPLWSLLQEEISGTHPHLESTPSKGSVFEDLFAGQFHPTFPVRYQLEACLSNGYLKEHNITSDFLEKLTAMEPRRAVYILEKVVDKQHVYYDPMDIFSIRVKDLAKKIPSYCILQRSVVITPTMMHVASPNMETSNRIIRKHAADGDRFIRVKFSDEKTEGQLRNMPNGRAEAAFDRVRRAMKYGIVVAGRYYEFLAFGNSQFREHGAYFYAPTSSKSADDIRISLGNFDHIKTVAKFGARLGQCFSTTRAMRDNVKVITIPDIIRNNYTFTDGVGKISLFLAQMAAQELGLARAFDDPPSLFQFRLGGCKGVLALDPKITGPEVHIRPSQMKFVAPYTGLEIIRSSSLATPFFNRQIIVVLSYLGVPDSVVIRKQQEMINDYETAMVDDIVALQKLRKHIDMNQTTLTIAGMVLDGFMKSQDPFVMSLLKLWRACTIKNLKEKARIAIDDGAFVLGCVDETATLRGHMNNLQLHATNEEKLATLPEIFLRVDDTSRKGHYKIIQGVCVLARNPSLHPGDLRVVRAVDVPGLHHLKNVVVLPQNGDRDLANMCSGGDLDGDDYMVLWDPDLIPQNVNMPAMDFTAEKPIETDDPITAAHIGEFFVSYMKNDTLGQIAHAHLAHADRQVDGVNDEQCLALAELHSKAVDFPKSGLPAEMTRELRPHMWPHFMEKKHLPESKIYHSRKVLGILYDQVQLVDFKPQWENPFDKRVLEAFELGDESLTKAAGIKTSYDEALRRLMAKHGIQTEFEAWSVFVIVHNHESRDYKFAEEFGRTIGAFKSQYRDECRAAAENNLEKFVAAMYIVTAKEMETALVECRTMKTVGGRDVPVRPMEPEHMPLISFPWLFPNELGKIATGGAFMRQLDVQQNMPTRPKKHPGSSTLVEVDTEIGVVETEAGITRYGELLDLDFSL